LEDNHHMIWDTNNYTELDAKLRRDPRWRETIEDHEGTAPLHSVNEPVPLRADNRSKVMITLPKVVKKAATIRAAKYGMTASQYIRFLLCKDVELEVHQLSRVESSRVGSLQRSYVE